MLSRFAAFALLLTLAVPATSFAIPSITASPAAVLESSAGVVINLYFNAVGGDNADGGTVFVEGSGTTTFSAVQGFPVNGAATSPTLNQTGPAPAANASFIFGPLGNPGGPVTGSNHFGSVTINAGAAGDNIVLGTGSDWVDTNFCASGYAQGVGSVLVSITPIPEPSSVILIGGALAGLAFLRRRA